MTRIKVDGGDEGMLKKRSELKDAGRKEGRKEGERVREGGREERG